MKNTFGNSIACTLFGESHGAGIGIVIDGLAPGISVDLDYIAHQLSLRRPSDALSTPRRETDAFRILSGVYNGKTTGTPLCIFIPNEDIKSGDYNQMEFVLRPGHADYTAQAKYHGFQDKRGGGHFSGRITAPLVAGGAVCLHALQKKGILIGTHIQKCGGVSDRPFSDDLYADIAFLADKQFAVLDVRRGEEMKEKILQAKGRGDSVGGVLETAILGLPAGVGEPWFDSLESMLSHALFSIPAVKGIEFGSGFSLADSFGSQANDPFCVSDGKIETKTNRNGGINGGISNGMPVIFRLAVKPTPTIGIMQETVDLDKMENTQLSGKGRHDPAIVHRARIVVDSLAAIVIADMLTQRYGTDFLGDVI